jgi:hypothetical protein
MIASAERITQGLVFAISDPSAGSSRTHQTAPRFGIRPRFGYNIDDGIPFALDRGNVEIGIGSLARSRPTLFLAPESGLDGLAHILGPLSRRYSS